MALLGQVYFISTPHSVQNIAWVIPCQVIMCPFRQRLWFGLFSYILPTKSAKLESVCTNFGPMWSNDTEWPWSGLCHTFYAMYNESWLEAMSKNLNIMICQVSSYISHTISVPAYTLHIRQNNWSNETSAWHKQNHTLRLISKSAIQLQTILQRWATFALKPLWEFLPQHLIQYWYFIFHARNHLDFSALQKWMKSLSNFINLIPPDPFEPRGF